jgi:phosphoglycerol transferase
MLDRPAAARGAEPARTGHDAADPADAGDDAASASTTSGQETGDDVLDLTATDDAVVTPAAVPVAEDAPADEPGVGAYGFPRGTHILRESALVCAVVAVAVTIVYKLWNVRPNVPAAYDGDGLFGDYLTKTLRDYGWILHNPRVGAPFSGNLYDYPPGGENIHYLSMKVLGYVLPSYAATQHAYFILSFFLVALAAYFVARYLKLGVGASLIVGVLYSFAPYHQAHGEAQITRSAYYIVPIVTLVILWLIDYRSRFFPEEETIRTSVSAHRGRWLFALGVCLVLGGSDTQNAIFAVCLIGSVAVALALANRDGRSLVLGVLMVVAIGGSLVVNNAPSILYRREHGKNAVAAVRSINEGDAFSLGLTRMLMPTFGNRIPALSNLSHKAATNTIVHGDVGEALGTFGAAGLVIAFVVALGRVFGGARRAPPRRNARARPGWWSRIEPLVGRLGGLGVVAVLFGMTGGISYLLAIFGLSQLRTWNRISVFIAFLVVLVVALLLDAWFRRLRRGRAGLAIVAAIVALVVVAGVFDQTTPKLVYNYRGVAQRYDVDNYFFTTLESRLPRAAMVFQYPIVPFPEEPPVGKMTDYTQFIGFLHTKHLRWSYGAIKGRPEADWQLRLEQLPVRTQLAGLAAAGFQGVFIDRDGYSDTGPAFEQSVAQLLGRPMLSSTDQRLVYYDLAPMRALVAKTFTPAQRSAFKNAVLHPVLPTYGTGFYQEERGAGHSWYWSAQRSELTLRNLGSGPQRVTIDATLSGHGDLVVSAGGHTEHHALNTTTDTPWHETLTLQPGDNVVRFDMHGVQIPPQGSDPRVLFFRVGDLRIVEPKLQTALCAIEPPGATRPTDCP